MAKCIFDKNPFIYRNFKGASTASEGKEGLVPAPTIDDTNKYLKGNGTWDTPPNTTYEKATANLDGLMSKEDFAKLQTIESGANKTIVDSALSGTSSNPVKNSAVFNALGTIENSIDALLSVKEVTLTASNWTSDLTYEATIAGITANDNPIIDVKLTGTTDEMKNLRNQWGYVLTAVTGSGKITFKAYKKPTVNLTVRIKGK